MKAFFVKVIDWIKSKSASLWSKIKGLFPWMKDKALMIFRKIKGFFSWSWNKIKAFGSWLKAKAKAGWNKVKSFFSKNKDEKAQFSDHKVKAEGKGHATPKQDKSKNGNKTSSKVHEAAEEFAKATA